MEIEYVKQKSRIHNICILTPLLLQWRVLIWHREDNEREQAAFALPGSVA